jgi:hypothetical protein
MVKGRRTPEGFRGYLVVVLLLLLLLLPLLPAAASSGNGTAAHKKPMLYEWCHQSNIT